MKCMHDKAWSPYAAGIVIGLLQVPAFLLVDTALGASSSYVLVAGNIASLFDPGVKNMAYFSKYLASPKDLWQTALVVGIALGAFLSMKSSGARRQAVSPVWRRAVGVESLAARAWMAFAGGFVLLFGARIAQGCTSGHGLSGSSQLAISSLIAVAAMFAGGIAVSLLLYRRV